MQTGHFFLDKDDQGICVCPKARELDALGQLPAPNRPGRNQPTKKVWNQRKQAFVVLDEQENPVDPLPEPPTIPLDNNDGIDSRNINTPPHGSNNDGNPADSDGARPGLVGSSTFDKKVNFLERDELDEEQVLTHEIMLELGYPSTLNFRNWAERFSVKMPAFYTQHAMSQDKIAGCSSWIWDSGSKVNVTGDKTIFVSPLRPSGIVLEGAVPGVYSDTLSGDALVRFRQTDGGFGPWILVQETTLPKNAEIIGMTSNKKAVFFAPERKYLFEPFEPDIDIDIDKNPYPHGYFYEMSGPSYLT
ncbi:hypothetical protein RI054_14g71160 [Pseudoscourfieldia marina]